MINCKIDMKINYNFSWLQILELSQMKMVQLDQIEQMLMISTII